MCLSGGIVIVWYALVVVIANTAEMWCVVTSLALLAAANAVPMSEDLFYRAPRLFHMDDFQYCLFKNGTYCMGTFEVTPEEGVELYKEMMVSEDRYHLNRSLLHRGLCVTSCEVDGDELSPAVRFERCVDQTLQRQYGLRARLQKLRYCKSREQPGIRKKDFTDLLVAAVVALIVLLNVVGTIYDYWKDPCAKPNKFLMAWSARANWNRMTAVYCGDQRLDALAPIHGIKAHLVVIVILAHTSLSMNIMYPYDERDFDKIVSSLQSNICMNGTMVVQTFAVVSSFLLAYMILVNFDKAKRTPSIKYWPVIVFSRYLRMAPTLLLVVGLTATWTARMAQGPQWHLVEEMEGACRRKWWAQLLFINNIVAPDDRCLVQSWFFAVEMQLFLVAVALALLLAAKPRYALHTLSALYVASLAVNLALNIKWKMVPVVTFATPDNLHKMAVGVESYVWMFQATWTSLPSSLHGLILAFTKHYLEKKGFKPEKHKWIGKMTWVIYACMIGWLMSGALWRQLESPFWLSVYASIDRTVWNAMVAFLIFAYINGYGGWVVRYLSWGGFQVIGRMVFPAMLLHWHVNLLPLAALPQPIMFNTFYVVTNWLYSVMLSLILAMPLHLFVEMPTQKMLG